MPKQTNTADWQEYPIAGSTRKVYDKPARPGTGRPGEGDRVDAGAAKGLWLGCIGRGLREGL